ncbi:hypothetical protein J437_LFUL012000 [Ladona fulva]|uniref:Chitin-binding type-2 domain-containing protein n=1 Tax=Ladona fulva TaxID=123851 RepID=A0A8K0K033_LADFU|nr:hypothetical protein J437_LFUL012000 [Ladona fulva]
MIKDIPAKLNAFSAIACTFHSIGTFQIPRPKENERKDHAPKGDDVCTVDPIARLSYLFHDDYLQIIPFCTITNGNDDIPCTRIGRTCRNCTTLGYCNGALEYDDTKQLTCPPNTVCDEWSLQCVRNGICRYKQVTCPITAGLIPDPYSCRGYIDCAVSYTYNCDPNYYYTNGTCKNATDEKSCEDYPVLCMEEGSRTTLDSCYTFECTKENNTLYPKFVGDECSSPSSSSTDKTTEVTTESTSTLSTEHTDPSTAETSVSDTTASVSRSTTPEVETTTMTSDSGTTATKEPTTNNSPSTTTEMSSSTETSVTTDHESSTTGPTSTTTEISSTATNSEMTTETGEMTTSVSTTQPNPTSTTTESTTASTPTTTSATITTPQATTSPRPFECTTEGNFEDSSDCTKYYRCSLVDGKFVKDHLSCRPGLHFDPGTSRCVPGDCSTSTSSPSSTTKTTPSTTESTTTSPPTTTPQATTSPRPFECTTEGNFEDPSDCSKYYRCTLVDGKFVKDHLSCRPGLHFDPGTSRCVPGDCSTSTSSPSSTTKTTPSTTESTTTSPPTTTPQATTSPRPFECTTEGNFEDPSDCSKYYRCTLVDGKFVKDHLSCRPGSHFDPGTSRCVPGDCEPTTSYTASSSTTPATESTIITSTEVTSTTVESTTSALTTTTMQTTTSSKPTTPTPFSCKEEGLFEDPLDCHKFYKCYLSGDSFVMQHISCRPGTYFDPSTSHCVLGECKMTTQMVSTTTITPKTTGVPTVPPPFTCKAEGFFPDPEDCTKFYKCYLSGDTFVQQHLSCRPGSYYDPASSHCVPGECTNSYKEEREAREDGKTNLELKDNLLKKLYIFLCSSLF